MRNRHLPTTLKYLWLSLLLLSAAAQADPGVKAPAVAPDQNARLKLDGEIGVGPALPEPPQNAMRHKKIVFIVDASLSMSDKWKFIDDELHKAIDALRPPQAFNVIFITDKDVSALNAAGAVFATPSRKREAYEFIKKAMPRGGKPDPIPAFTIALGQKADLVYLLSDAGFANNAAAVEQIRKLNTDNKAKINTIALINDDEECRKTLKKIAADSGGTFKIVTADSVKP